MVLGRDFSIDTCGSGSQMGSLNIKSVLCSKSQVHLTAQHHQYQEDKAHERHTRVSLTVQSAPRKPHLSREGGPDDTTGVP